MFIQVEQVPELVELLARTPVAVGWIPLALGAASFLGGLLGGKKKKTTTESKQQSTSVPTLAPQFQGLQDVLMPMITSRLANPQALPKEYERQGIRDINRTYDLAGQSAANNLTARGLGSSPIAGAVEGRMQAGRAGDIVKMQGQLPILQRQMQDQDLARAMQFLLQGRGQTTTGTGTSTTTEGGQGGLLGGLQGLGSMLPWLLPGGGFGGGGGFPNAVVPPGGTIYSPIIPGSSFGR